MSRNERLFFFNIQYPYSVLLSLFRISLFSIIFHWLWTCKQFDKQPSSAASAHHLHHREDRQQCARAPTTLFLMKYYCWSTSAEDRLFDATLCIHAGWPNPSISGHSRCSLAPCSQFLATLLKCFLYFFLELISNFALFCASLPPAVCSLKRAVCSQLNNTLGNPTKAPCFQLLCKRFKRAAHVFFSALCLICLALCLLHLLITEGKPFHSPVPVSLTQPIIPSL